MTVDRFAASTKAMSFSLLIPCLLLLSAYQVAENISPVVHIRPGDDIQLKVTQYPSGTTFRIEPGLYRLQQIKPKDNDSFVGAGTTTIVSGAVLLKSFEKLGNFYWTTYRPQQEQVHGGCNSVSPMCKYPEDLFLDNKPLRRVATESEVVSGTWMLDGVRGIIVLADDPTGHTAEVSAARSAFSGSASNVIISDLTVEKYAIPAQMGAIGDNLPVKRWHIVRCIIRWNHGSGVNVSDDSLVSNNRIVANGQLGVSAHGDNVVISDNEIAFNNFAGFSNGWESGGAKFSRTKNLRVVGNVVHDNNGTGLWTDVYNYNALYQLNTVFDNSGMGIQHEISFAVKIIDNTVWGNGRDQSVWLWGAQILIQNSSDGEVANNKVFVPKGYGNGIGIIAQNRNGPVASNNYIHDNDVTYLGSTGMSGAACDFEPLLQLLSTNHLDRNHYHVLDRAAIHWFWHNGKHWDELRATGNEMHGTVDTKVQQQPTHVHVSS